MKESDNEEDIIKHWFLKVNFYPRNANSEYSVNSLTEIK